MNPNLPSGLSPSDLDDDLHFVSSDDPDWEREIENADDREGDGP